MLKISLYQNNNKKSQAYKKWYPRVVPEETIGLDELAEHMASHNTPFSKGAIKGILTDAVSCVKELLLQGKNVKFPDLAIFSLGLKVKGGADTKEEFSIVKFILGLKFRARGTGELASANLDTTIKRVEFVKSSSTKTPTEDGTTGGTTPSGGDTGTDAGTDSGTDAGTGGTGEAGF